MDMDQRIALDATLRPIINQFQSSVYQHVYDSIAASPLKGMSAHTGNVSVRTYTIAGRTLITISSPQDDQVTLIAASGDRTAPIYVQSCNTTVEFAIYLLMTVIHGGPFTLVPDKESILPFG